MRSDGVELELSQLTTLKYRSTEFTKRAATKTAQTEVKTGPGDYVDAD